jgi:hypothetical protein
MSLVVTCTGCGTRLKAPSTATGKSVKCPKCGIAVGVPTTEESPPVPPQPPPLPPPVAEDLPEDLPPEEQPRKRRKAREDEEDDEDDEDDDRPRRRLRRDSAKKGVPLWVWGAIAACLLLPLACCGGFFALGFKKGLTEKPPEYTKMTPDQLIDEWKANPAAAASKYKADGVELTGTLKEINSNLAGQTYIDVRGSTADDNWKRSTHIFVIETKAKDGLKKCVIGGRITVKARATGEAQDRPWLRADDIRPGE